jgi:hypothetical protein
MRIKYEPKQNFHNQPSINLMVGEAEKIPGMVGEMGYRLSHSQAQKIAKHFCGVAYCRCGSSGLYWDWRDGKYGTPWIEKSA